MEARRKWKAMNLDSIGAQLVTKLTEQVGSCAAFNTEKRFIPHPATYLNQGRWEDEIQEMEMKLPTRDEELPAYAAAHDLPAPRPGEDFRQYRARLEVVARTLSMKAGN